MIITNTDYITGKNLEIIGIVSGWEMGVFRIDLAKAANAANESMAKNAQAMNADAVVNVRYAFSGDGKCVLATGTAVRFI